jgi:hypothetical protein
MADNGIGGAFGLFGSAVQGLFGSQASKQVAQGEFQAAGFYQQAANIATHNIGLEKESVDIQEAQLNRKIEQTIGTQTADIAGANLSGGSAGDLLRDSLRQGGLAKAIVSIQGSIQENAFAQQASAYGAMSASATAAGNAAETSSQGQLFGGILSGIGGILKLGGLFGL